MGFAILSAVGIMAFVSAPFLVSFFVPGDTRIIDEGAHFLRIMAPAWGGIGIQLCIVSAFRASGNMLNAMVIALVSQWMIQFPLGYILSQHNSLHADGLWWSFPVTNILIAVISLCWFARGGWKTAKLTQQEKEVANVSENAIAQEGIR